MNEFFSALESIRVNVDNRHIIKRGTDVLYPIYIVLYAHDSLVGKTIRSFTHQPYSHASVSFDSSMTNMYTFGNKMVYDEKTNTYKRKFGAGRETFAKADDKWAYPEKTPYVIYVLFLPKENIMRMKKRVHEIYNKPEMYRFSYDGLVKYYMGISSESTYKMFCSQFVASLLMYGGYDLDRLPSLYSPYELKDLNDVIFVEDGVIKDFNRNKFNKKMDAICSDIKNGLKKLDDMDKMSAE